jgi:hypothetical protein
MSCKELKTKKYKSRSSPAYSAMDCKGKTMKGNDGQTYISKADKNGVYKWVLSKTGTKKASKSVTKTRKNKKISTLEPENSSKNVILDLSGKKPKHKYTIEDNGDSPYIVYDYGNRVEVYGQDYDEEKNAFSISEKLLDTKYKKLFVGDNDINLPNYEKKGKWRGNTVLLETGPGKYIFIGNGIREFTTVDGDTIEKYYSPLGNNFVPYPYAVGKKYTYFMLDNGGVKEGPKYYYIPNEDLNLKEDPYQVLYGFVESKLIGTSPKTYKVKVLRKRFDHYGWWYIKRHKKGNI